MDKLIKQGYIGNPSQLITLRRIKIEEGKAKGTQIIEIKTADGLELDILPDLGLDIGQCRYKGVNMSWLSKNGYDSPAVFHPYENEFVNTFPGGLLYTCGLRSAGPANRDGEEWHPLHGRYHSIAAEQVCAEIKDNEIIVSGTIRETALFGHNLEVKRILRIPVFGSTVVVNDTISNLSSKNEEIMMIYHCNFGYRAENELNRMLDSRQMAVDDIKTKLIEYASLQYNDIHNEKYEAQRLKDLFLNQKATDGFSADLFNRTVTAVSFDSDNNVTITLLNGQTIGKELTDGTAEEKSYGYQSDNHRQRGYQEQISAETSCGVLPGIHSAGRTNQQL